MTLQPRCEDVETAEGVAITVTGVAQVRPHPGVFLSYRQLYLLLIVFNHKHIISKPSSSFRKYLMLSLISYFIIFPFYSQIFSSSFYHIVLQHLDFNLMFNLCDINTVW